MTAAWTPRAAGPLAYAAELVLAVTLTGCTSGGSTPPVPSPTSTTPPSSTSSPPPTPSATTAATTTADPAIAKIPAAARPETEEGSIAFAEYYMIQVNRAFTEASPDSLSGLSTKDCRACVAFRESAEELKKAGLRHSDKSLETTAASSDQFTASRRTVALWVTQHSVPVVNQSGKKVRTTTAGSGTLLATLIFKDHWVITNLQVVK